MFLSHHGHHCGYGIKSQEPLEPRVTTWKRPRKWLSTPSLRVGLRGTADPPRAPHPGGSFSRMFPCSWHHSAWLSKLCLRRRRTSEPGDTWGLLQTLAQGLFLLSGLSPTPPHPTPPWSTVWLLSPQGWPPLTPSSSLFSAAHTAAPKPLPAQAAGLQGSLAPSFPPFSALSFHIPWLSSSGMGALWADLEWALGGQGPAAWRRAPSQIRRLAKLAEQGDTSPRGQERGWAWFPP